MISEMDILDVLNAHVQSFRNKRCTCGWRPKWPDDRIGAEYFQHREHLAEMLAMELQDREEKG